MERDISTRKLLPSINEVAQHSWREKRQIKFDGIPPCRNRRYKFSLAPGTQFKSIESDRATTSREPWR
jgi:hypothetical protein